MNKKTFPTMSIVYVGILCGILMLSVICNKVVTVISENTLQERKKCVIIDAGHGGVDGGATSCTGVLESNMNLDIALRLDDLFRLLGYKTLMIRSTDISIYTEGNSIAAKKVSDLKNRVKIVNETEESILVSIHQNHFSDSKYNGAQVFYNHMAGSKELANNLQSAMVNTLNKGSKRQAKNADGVYLMQKINRPGILVECGFISNTEEEYKLRDSQYQKKLCVVIATSVSAFIANDLIA